MVFYKLPQELIDEILKYTDLQTVTNCQYSSDYIIKYMKNKEKDYLYSTYNFVSDISVLTGINSIYGISSPKLNCVLHNYNEKINLFYDSNDCKLIIAEPFKHINNLQLKIFNPLNKNIIDIIDKIVLTIDFQC